MTGLTATRIYITVAALFGTLGVTALAGGAHAAGPQMTLAGQMLLFHAPALIAGALARRTGHLHGRLGQLGLALLALGIALFSADMGLRGALGVRLFAMAAPIGGVMMILGWLLVGVAALKGGEAR